MDHGQPFESAIPFKGRSIAPWRNAGQMTVLQALPSADKGNSAACTSHDVIQMPRTRNPIQMHLEMISIGRERSVSTGPSSKFEKINSCAWQELFTQLLRTTQIWSSMMFLDQSIDLIRSRYGNDGANPWSYHQDGRISRGNDCKSRKNVHFCFLVRKNCCWTEHHCEGLPIYHLVSF